MLDVSAHVSRDQIPTWSDSSDKYWIHMCMSYLEIKFPPGQTRQINIGCIHMWISYFEIKFPPGRTRQSHLCFLLAPPLQGQSCDDRAYHQHCFYIILDIFDIISIAFRSLTSLLNKPTWRVRENSCQQERRECWENFDLPNLPRPPPPPLQWSWSQC